MESKMADVSIRVMSMNPKREYNIKVKGLNPEQLPDYGLGKSINDRLQRATK